LFFQVASSTGNQLSYTQTISIQAGGYYKFEVVAINAVGTSGFSLPFTIIAAVLPG
jgi:hypothetical protein